MKRTQLQQSLFLLLFIALSCAISPKLFAQQTKGKIHGRILDPANKPLENVTIALQGTLAGTMTDEKGEYTLRAAAGTYTLVVSHIGAQGKQVQIMVIAGQTTKIDDIIVNLTSGTLQEINVSDSKINKFVKKSSDYPAK